MSRAMSRYFVATIIFFTSFLSFAYLTQRDDGNPQIVTRIALTLSMVESGTFDIDRFEALTVDKAVVGAHVYADKLPGLSLLAVPVVTAARAAWIAGGETLPSTDPQMRGRYTTIAAMGTVELLAALATATLYLLALRLGADHRSAVFAAFALALATPFFGWATAFFAHAVTGSLLLIALALIVRFGGAVAGAAGIGLLLGVTLVVDLTAAPAVAALGLLMVWRVRRVVPIVIAGASGIIGLLPLLAYNAAVFGSPFTVGYAAVVGFEGMREGFFGIGLPDPGAFAQLLVGLYRGLLPLAPVLLLVPVGLWTMALRRDLRPIAIVAGGVFFTYVWINAGYYYWDGGSSTGPRHLVAALPLLALALAFVPVKRMWQQAVAGGLLTVSLAVSLVCASTDMFNPVNFSNPFFQRLLPHFLLPENLLRAAPILVSWAIFGWLLLAPQERRATS